MADQVVPNREPEERITDFLLTSQFTFLLDLNAKLDELDISYRHYSLLGCLQMEPLIMKEIAEKFSMQPAGVTEMIDSLAKKGLVQRVPSERDRRKIEVQITPKGVDLVRVMREATQELVMRAMKAQDVGNEEELEFVARQMELLRG